MAAEPMSMDDVRAARTLLTILFGQKEDGAQIVLCQLDPVVRTTSFTDVGSAATWAAGRTDVYLHVGLTRRPFSGRDRPKAAEIDGLSGLWADVDIAHDVHKKQGYPPDTDAALAVIRAMGVVPGAIIHSGHGIHAYWPFSGEPLMFDDDSERQRARILTRAWAITLRERAKALGFAIDMVSDIARLLRVPGTVNNKDAPVPVTILDASGTSISEDDAVSVLLDGSWEQAERETRGRSATDAVSYGTFTLDPKAEPPFDKFVALCEAESRFRQSWDHRRKDLDGTASAYDFSLALFAVQADWPDQEIVNLIIACRRRHGDDLKLRQNYFDTTVGKARSRFAADSESARLFDALDALPPLATTDDTVVTTPEDRLAIVSDLLKVKVTRFVQFRADPPQYRLETELGAITLGEASAVLSVSRFRAAIFAATQRVVPRFKDKDWDRVVQALGDACIMESIGDEATEAGIARAWLASYVSKHPVIEDIAESVASNHAFLRDGAVHIWGERLQQFLATSYFDKVTSRQMGTALRIFGAAAARVHVKKQDGSRTTRSAWRLPDGWQDIEVDNE